MDFTKCTIPTDAAHPCQLNPQTSIHSCLTPNTKLARRKYSTSFFPLPCLYYFSAVSLSVQTTPLLCSAVPIVGIAALTTWLYFSGLTFLMISFLVVWGFFFPIPTAICPALIVWQQFHGPKLSTGGKRIHVTICIEFPSCCTSCHT